MAPLPSELSICLVTATPKELRTRKTLYRPDLVDDKSGRITAPTRNVRLALYPVRLIPCATLPAPCYVAVIDGGDSAPLILPLFRETR